MKTTYFGLVPYSKSMELQAQAFQLVENSGFPVVLGFEYYPVVTLGKRGDADSDLNQEPANLLKKGVELIETDRGGQATLHSPGQLVIYPIVPIKKLQISVKQFVQVLEDSTIHWLKKYGIDAHRSEDAGVFTDRGKIAFIGIRVEKGITRHGISININNDLSLFREIKACGMAARPLDSLFQQGVELELKASFQDWMAYFTSELLKQISI